MNPDLTMLKIGNDAFNHSPGIEFLDGVFQAFSVRCGEFYVVNISSLRIALQVLYVIMMYISALPIAITIRNSNIYGERSLGIYSDDPEDEQLREEGGVSWFRRAFPSMRRETSRGYFIQQQLRAQLAHDIWWLVLAIFMSMVVESAQFDANPAVFSVFNVIFEVVSGTTLLMLNRVGLTYC